MEYLLKMTMPKSMYLLKKSKKGSKQSSHISLSKNSIKSLAQIRMLPLTKTVSPFLAFVQYLDTLLSMHKSKKTLSNW